MRARLALLAACALAGCAPGRGVVVVTLTSQPPLVSVDKLGIHVTSAAGRTVDVERALADVEIGASGPTFSLSFGPDAEGRVVLAVEAFDGAVALARAEAAIDLSPSESTSITLSFSGGTTDLGDADMTPPPDLTGLPAHCMNTTIDGDETDVDCGGSCAPCAVDMICVMASDCGTRLCTMSRCTRVSGPPSWIRVADMPTARGDHAAGTHADGRLYAIGGFISANTDVVESYAPDTWATAPALPAATSALAVVSNPLDSRVYVVGGSTTGPSTQVLALANDGLSWQTQTPLGSPHAYHAAAVTPEGRIYALGGGNGLTVAVALSESWKPGDAGWVNIAQMSSPRARHCAAAGGGGRVFVFGGSATDITGASPVNSAEVYDRGTNTWSPLPDLPAATSNCQAVLAADGRITILPAIPTSGPELKTPWAYNGVTNRYDALAPMIQSHPRGGATVAPDGRIFAIGSASAESKLVEAYGPVITTISSATGVAVDGSNFAADATVTVTIRSLATGSPGAVLETKTGATDATGEIVGNVVLNVPAMPGLYRITAIDQRSLYPAYADRIVTP